MSFGIYMTGFVLVIAGLLYGASLMHVPTHWNRGGRDCAGGGGDSDGGESDAPEGFRELAQVVPAKISLHAGFLRSLWWAGECRNKCVVARRGCSKEIRNEEELDRRLLFSAVLIGTAPAQVGVYMGGRRRRCESSDVGRCLVRAMPGWMDIGLRTWGIIAGWQGGGTVRRMKEPTGTTLIMITTGKGGSCMKAIGIMRIMGARLVTTRSSRTLTTGKAWLFR